MTTENAAERRCAWASPSVCFAARAVAAGWRLPALLLLGATAWLLVLAVFPPIDYDELALVHFAWLIAQGLVPYQDFHAVHPPFFALLVSPVVRVLPEAFGSMVILRLINVLASLAVLVFLARLLLARTEEPRERWLALAALVIMATHPGVWQALAEFRPDHLSAALTLAALGVAASDKGRPGSRYFIASALFTIAMALNAKLILVPLFTALVLAVEEGRRGLDALGGLLAGALAGSASSLAVTVLVGHLWGIDFRLLWEQAFVYHEYFRQTFTDSFGLARGLRSQIKPQWGLPVVALFLGAIGMLAEARRGRWDRLRVPVILAAYAVIQPLWVPFPHKQYSYTIDLAWSAPLALGFAAVQRWRPRAMPAVAATLLALSLILAGVRTGRIVARGGVLSQMQLGNTLLALAPPGQPVAAVLPVHPIFRRDATFSWIYTDNPGGLDTGEVMARMPRYRERFSHDGYLRQLRANPPSLIVLHSRYVHAEYRRAAADFLASEAHRYAEVWVGQVRVFVRRDRAGEGARAVGEALMSTALARGVGRAPGGMTPDLSAAGCQDGGANG